MSKSVHGVLRSGRIELLEPLDEPEGTEVVVMLPGEPRSIDLRERGISAEQAAEIRGRFLVSAEDWDSPELDVYDRL